MEGRRHTGATRRRTSDLRLESILAARLHVDPTASRDPSPAPGPMLPTTSGIIAIIVLRDVIIIARNLKLHASLTAFSIFLASTLN